MSWWILLWIIIGFNVLYVLLEGLSWVVGKISGRSIKARLKRYLLSKGVPVA
jgi:hypothetical protein